MTPACGCNGQRHANGTSCGPRCADCVHDCPRRFVRMSGNGHGRAVAYHSTLECEALRVTRQQHAARRRSRRSWFREITHDQVLARGVHACSWCHAGGACAPCLECGTRGGRHHSLCPTGRRLEVGVAA